jgi:polyisoprenoid-binding protein YceI
MRPMSLAAFLLAAATALFATDRYAPAPGSMVRIDGTSTMQAWSMEGQAIAGDIRVTDPVTKAAQVSVTVPVTSLRSGTEAMDRLMVSALKAAKHPQIRYVMKSSRILEEKGPTFSLKTDGTLSIAGVTRPLAMTVAGMKTRDGRYVLAGKTALKMSDFGVTPPKAMMDTVEAGDEVQITFRWVVKAEP